MNCKRGYHAMSRIVQLNILFDEWKKEQCHEVDNYNKLEESEKNKNYLQVYKDNELIKINIKNSFTTDGIVCESKWNNGVLFILKEANISKQLINASDDTVIADNGEYWFQKTLMTKNYNWRKKLFRRLRKIGESWNDGNKEFNLLSVAYMNINKRGGLAKAKEDVIEAYLKRYQCQILEEIKIINPSKIAICCGEQEYVKFLAESIKNKEWGKNIEIRCYKHPSMRKGTEEGYLNNYSEYN